MGARRADTGAQAAGSNGSDIARRANIVAGQSVEFSGACSNPKAICWVNPNGFMQESSLGAGSAPIGNIIGPNFYQWDLSARKTFNLPCEEGMKLQFQVHAFHSFHRANWHNPTVT